MSAKRILIVDDEPLYRAMLEKLCASIGYHTDTAEDGPGAVRKAQSAEYDAVLLDLSLPGMNGLDVLAEIKRMDSRTAVIMITAYASVSTAVQALRLGAYDYISKPCSLEEVSHVLHRALERTRLIDENRYLRGEMLARYGFDNIVGNDPEVQKAYVLAAQVAQTNVSVLITGETGTGKEFLAKTIHYQSLRADGPFVCVNCAALPESLLESELFGHEKGAFTGAVARRAGRFEIADGGTLFLDEIGDLNPSVQVKLLRVLQEKQFERVGGSETVTSDVRIISATNTDLDASIKEKKFREDLFFRLNVIIISIPPLRKRTEDIVPLAEYFLEQLRAETGKHISAISSAAIDRLLAYGWPGNIRELRNCIERAVILTNTDEIQLQCLGLPSGDGPAGAPLAESPPPDDGDLSLKAAEKRHIARALRLRDWNQTAAAADLGIDRKTLRSKIREYGLTN